MSGRRSRVRFLRTGFLWVIIIGISAFGCAPKARIVQNQIPVDETSATGTAAWPDQQLKDKFKEYWGYRLEGDAEQSLMREAPYAREMLVLEQYNGFIRGVRNRKWAGIQIAKIVWKTKQLIYVDFDLQYRDDENKMVNIYFHDPWIIMGNQWYHAFKDPVILPD
jgi:hypothetical protein